MSYELLINAILIIVALAVWEFIKSKVKRFANTDYVSKVEFNELKKDYEKLKLELPEKYVLYSRYKGEADKAEKNHKEGLEGIWKKIDELLKLYYED